MKLHTIVLSLVALSFFASLFAADIKETLPKSGIASVNQYGKVDLDALDAVGLIKLSGTSVANTLRLAGSLISQNAKIGSLDVTGEANLTETTIKDGGFVMGSLQAVRSTFQGNLTILTPKALFTASRLEGVTVRQDGSYRGKQIIELKQGTIINGPIHFESGKGEVVVFPGCQVLGKVTGGKIVRKSS